MSSSETWNVARCRKVDRQNMLGTCTCVYACNHPRDRRRRSRDNSSSIPDKSFSRGGFSRWWLLTMDHRVASRFPDKLSTRAVTAYSAASVTQIKEPTQKMRGRGWYGQEGAFVYCRCASQGVRVSSEHLFSANETHLENLVSWDASSRFRPPARAR